jgi:hypothetical protein
MITSLSSSMNNTRSSSSWTLTLPWAYNVVAAAADGAAAVRDLLSLDVNVDCDDRPSDGRRAMLETPVTVPPVVPSMVATVESSR